MALLKPEGLVHGHYECRSLDETLPLFTDLLACDVVLRDGPMAAVRHPNTDLDLGDARGRARRARQAPR